MEKVLGNPPPGKFPPVWFPENIGFEVFLLS
jgi:hypothetical protein